MCNAAWAGGPIDLGNGTSRLGAEDNSTAWWTDFTDYVEIAPNKTLTYTFVNHSSKAAIFANWALQIIAESNYEWLLMRSDCYGVTGGDWDNKNTNKPGWFLVNYDDYDRTTDDVFKNNLDGATVVMTIKRNDASLILIEDVTTSDGTKKFRHFFAMECEADKNNKLKARLTVDRAHLIINNTVPVVDSDPLQAVTGIQVGRSDLATPWWTAHSPYYIIKGGETAKLHFKNYSCKAKNQNNWVLVVTNDNNREEAEYKEYFALRSDHFGWNGQMGDYWNSANLTSNYNWGTYRDEMNGADVVMTIERDGDNVSITAVQTAATDGSTVRTESYTFTESSTNTIRVFLTIEGGMLDILPESIEISTIGWGTFVSDNALDFTTPIAGLTPYMVTGHTGNAITLSEVTTTVPARTPLLLKGTAGNNYTIPVVASSSTDVSSNKLQRGTGTVSYEAGKTRYVLSADGTTPIFKKLVDGTPAPVTSNKAYLEFDETIDARELTFDFDSETTAISELTNTNLTNYTNEYFNLAGQRVANPTKGLYIVNGKKVVVK